MADAARYEGTNDQELIALHLRGDPEAFGELVRRHRDRLWAVALRTLGDREEAADAVQDALVSAYRRAHTFRGHAAVTTWLHRITVNACLDRARKAATRRTSPVDDAERLDQLLEPHEAASAPAERNDLHRELINALATLPPDQRAALVLVDMQGFPVAEAAGVLDVPVGTVKSRCARGRARLLPLLTHLRPPAEERETHPPGPPDEGRKHPDEGRNPPGEGRNRPPRASVPPGAPNRTTPGPIDPATAKGGGERA
ncbi:MULTISPECIES: RNA polymerase sigma factor SigM [Streptomyces]|uniref:RNA polymerase sigma factor SigM n=1 Tax=Streptomyces TaxID=1883 RepID=UPI000AC7CEEB|nr:MULTISPECIES: RNA polymerase sigma factor SigM [Streptomyces]MDH6226065.1 RNA polymerase sigma-70 factor (ECF subfamily) [Streptomyces sp. MJP52]